MLVPGILRRTEMLAPESALSQPWHRQIAPTPACSACKPCRTLRTMRQPRGDHLREVGVADPRSSHCLGAITQGARRPVGLWEATASAPAASCRRDTGICRRGSFNRLLCQRLKASNDVDGTHLHRRRFVGTSRRTCPRGEGGAHKSLRHRRNTPGCAMSNQMSLKEDPT
jgi:hypothetical protein